MKRMMMLLAALLLCLAGLSASAEGSMYYTLGSQADDFTVTTYDGRSVSLSETLKEKDMVLLNIWASWCGPCKMEFPFMQEAYARYQNQVEVIAVSCEAEDDDEVLRAFAGERGLTFPVARDTANLALRFQASSIPTSVVIDRFGRVCYIHTGAITSAETFANLFDVFVGDGYTESLLLSSIPVKSSVPVAAVDKLAEALNAEGGSLAFTNPSSQYVWPMIPAEEDERLCLMSANKGCDGSRAVVYTAVEAEAGDVLAFSFKTSTEAGCDLLKLQVNGETVKVFGGKKDWTRYAWAFPAAGSYEIAFVYEKNAAQAAGEDVVYIDDAALLKGEEAAAALAGNPVYPAAGSTTLTLRNPDARPIAFADPTYALLNVFGLADYYIVPGGEASFRATLAENVDPEAALIVNYYDGSVRSVTDFLTAEGYDFTTKIDSVATTGYSYTNVQLFPAERSAVIDIRTAVCFASETDANAFVQMLAAYGYPVTGWSYLDADGGEEEPVPDMTAGQALYTLTFIDQQGEAIPGVKITVCDPDTCEVMSADENGVISFAAEPYAWEVHVISAPEGCSFDADAVWTLSPEGGETIIALERTVSE